MTISDAKQFAVTMGMDAFRIAIGVKPQNHTVEDVIRWLKGMAETELR